jgi:hypothetical protein
VLFRVLMELAGRAAAGESVADLGTDFSRFRLFRGRFREHFGIDDFI